MNNKRIIHELAVEDLIALAHGASEEDIVDKMCEAAKFIYEMNIKHGDARIPVALIYHTYKVWKGWNQKKQSKPFFFRDFKKYFTPYRNGDGMHYLLNPKPFDLSEETKWLYRKEEREAKAKRK